MGCDDVLPLDDEITAWREYSEAADLLRTEVKSRMQRESTISPGDYAVLLVLIEAPGRRLRPSRLAAAVDWERSRLSHHLSRMQARGLVTREGVETDNRGTEVVLTEEGSRLFRAATAPLRRTVRELFIDALSSEELDWALTIAERLRAHLTGEGDG